MQDILKRVQDDQPLTLLNLYQLIGCTIAADSGIANAIIHVKKFELFITGDCLNEGQQDPTEAQIRLAHAFSKALSNWSILTGMEMGEVKLQSPFPTVDLLADSVDKVAAAIVRAGKTEGTGDGVGQ
jgi:hypothetical protein